MGDSIDKTILWQGKISQKKGLFVTTRYAWVYGDKVIIRKKGKEDSKLVVEITKDRVVSVDFPKLGAKEALLTGFKGFVVKYREGEKEKTISFWAKGFGAYPNKQEQRKLTEAMAEFADRELEEVKESADVFSFSKYMILLALVIVGYFLAGITGGIVMGLSGFIALTIYNKKELDSTTRIALIGASLSVGCVITIILMFVLGVGISLLQGTG